MGKSGRKFGKFDQIDGRTIAERVAAFLREQHPEKTALSVSAETGISAETVRKWIEQGSVPNGKAMLALFIRYRFAFLNTVLGDDVDGQIVELARLETQAHLEERAAVISRQLAAVMEGRAR